MCVEREEDCHVNMEDRLSVRVITVIVATLSGMLHVFHYFSMDTKWNEGKKNSTISILSMLHRIW